MGMGQFAFLLGTLKDSETDCGETVLGWDKISQLAELWESPRSFQY